MYLRMVNPSPFSEASGKRRGGDKNRQTDVIMKEADRHHHERGRRDNLRKKKLTFLWLSAKDNGIKP